MINLFGAQRFNDGDRIEIAGGTVRLKVSGRARRVSLRLDVARREVLAIDSYSESASEKIRDHVREVIDGTEIGWPVSNADGYEVGRSVSYGAFWADLDIVRDFNLLWRVK